MLPRACENGCVGGSAPRRGPRVPDDRRWSYRTEVLNAYLVESLTELRALTDAWLRIYNGERPHDSLGRVPPLTFLPRHSAAGQSPFELSA